MRFKLITPTRLLYEKDEIYQVNLPSSDGELGIRSHHMNLVTALKPGVIEVFEKAQESPDHFVVFGGVVEITGNEVKVLATTAENASEIDEAKLIVAKEKAEHAKSEAKSDIELAETSAILERELARLRTIERRKKYKR